MSEEVKLPELLPTSEDYNRAREAVGQVAPHSRVNVLYSLWAEKFRRDEQFMAALSSLASEREAHEATSLLLKESARQYDELLQGHNALSEAHEAAKRLAERLSAKLEFPEGRDHKWVFDDIIRSRMSDKERP